jgi:hypothetical protein
MTDDKTGVNTVCLPLRSSSVAVVVIVVVDDYVDCAVSWSVWREGASCDWGMANDLRHDPNGVF